VIHLSSKTVIITGAGYSVPAKLPVQNAILKDMIEKPDRSFVNGANVVISMKFLQAFIEVGIYLLSEYSNCPIDSYENEYIKIRKSISEKDTVKSIKTDLLKNNIPIKIVNSVFEKYLSSNEEIYKKLVLLKETIRAKLESQDIDINLEDVFTSFDKTLITKEHGHNYTYSQMDSLKHSIMRLFVFYFGLQTSKHKLNHDDYLQTMEFIKRSYNPTTITTNWDTIFENYLNLKGIPYNHCLNDVYFKYDTKKKNTKTKSTDLKLIKVHGSINWCKCLSCGNILIVEKEPYGAFLFDDDTPEKCEICGRKATIGFVQMQPEIITPTMIKTISSQLFNNLWRAAAFELSNADKIIFIGYSLPIADYEFRYLLKKNISTQAKIDVILAPNDNPDRINKRIKDLTSLLPQNRFTALFPQNPKQFYYDGFGKYFKNLNNINKQTSF
jgi:NAD-dependent SIR2 family protein deacetylase